MSFVVPSIFTAVDKLSGPVRQMEKSVSSFADKANAKLARLERGARKTQQVASEVAVKSAVAATAIAAPIALAVNEAIKFEDKMANVAKTTGLAGKELIDFGDGILKMSSKTRTSIDDLVSIAEIGGQLGVGKKDLNGFVQAINKVNVAIGKDFAGGVEEATSKLGGINSLFKETKSINISEAILKTGSAINELGAVGSATSANVADFANRIGALPDSLKPAVQDTLALGAFFEEVGISSEIASGGITNFLLVAGKNIPLFSKQMRLSEAATKSLLAQDPTNFAKRFAGTLQGLKPDQLALKLKELGIGTQETIKVLGSLGSNTKRLTELQDVANKSFAQGISINNEYEKVNNTTAGRLAQAQNRFKALSITLGAQLLPVINKLIEKAVPIIEGIMNWTRENKPLVKQILVVGSVISGLLFTLSAFSTVISVVSGAIASWAVVQAWINTLLFANPIGLIVLAIAALIGYIILVTKHWNEWGAAINAIFSIGSPVLGRLIALVMTFYNNWDKIVKSFKDGGFIAGIKMIGKALIDVVLQPLSQILGLVAKLTGADWAANFKSDIDKMRMDLGVSEEKPQVNPKQAEQDAMISRMEVSRQQVDIGIKDETGRAKVNKNTGGIPVVLTSTMGMR